MGRWAGVRYRSIDTTVSLAVLAHQHEPNADDAADDSHSEELEYGTFEGEYCRWQPFAFHKEKSTVLLGILHGQNNMDYLFHQHGMGVDEVDDGRRRGRIGLERGKGDCSVKIEK